MKAATWQRLKRCGWPKEQWPVDVVAAYNLWEKASTSLYSMARSKKHGYIKPRGNEDLELFEKYL